MVNYQFGRGKARLVPYLLLAPGILFYVVIMLGPSIATSVYSFTDATGIKGAAITLDRAAELQGIPLHGPGVA